MGKREIGELSILDLVVFIMIGEMAVLGIEKYRTSLMETVLPMFILMALQISLAYVSLKIRFFRKIMDGEPSIIIKNGKIDEKEMRKQRYNFDDLLMQLRDKEVTNIADVEFAILEPNGKLSVIKKGMDHEKQTLAIPLILDGKIQDDKLRAINRTKEWLFKELEKLGYTNVQRISICSFANGEFFVDEKND